MLPIFYKACSAPIIGTTILLSGLYSNPIVIDKENISLEETGLVLSKEFEAPTSTNYQIYLNFEVSPEDEGLSDTLIGTESKSHFCNGLSAYESIPKEERIGLWQPILFKVSIYSHDGRLLIERKVNSLFDVLTVL